MEDMDSYVIEYMLRERLTNARARARVAAQLRDANGPRRHDVVKTRFARLRGELVKGLRTMAGEISHARPGGTRIAKHS